MRKVAPFHWVAKQLALLRFVAGVIFATAVQKEHRTANSEKASGGRC